MKKYIIWFIIYLSLTHGISHTQTQKHPSHKVIIQLTSADPEVHKNLMNQIQALKSRWADSVQIEVVVHGPGIDILLKEKTSLQDKISEFKRKGVTFFACENTLRQKSIPHSALINDISFVPFGLVYIIQKQEQGWSYLKAGF